MNTTEFQPVFPKLTVGRIDTVEDLQEIYDLSRSHPEFFPQLKNKDYTIRDGEIGTLNLPELLHRKMLAQTYAKVGDYIVRSENGLRYITSDALVRHGVFNNFPVWLFTPIEGKKVQNGEQQ